MSQSVNTPPRVYEKRSAMDNQDWAQVVLNARPTTTAEKKMVAAIRSAMGQPATESLRARASDRADESSSSSSSSRVRKGIDEAGAEPDLPILNAAMRQRLIQARCARKMNQQALATAANLRVQVIQELEGGKPVAEPGVLQKLSRVLGKDLRLRFGKSAVV